MAENLQLGGYLYRSGSAEFEMRFEGVLDTFPVLRERLSAVAGNLSGGQQQMLAIGRGLMAHPQLLILDEPSLGLSPLMVSEMFSLIGRLRDQGLAVLLSEQNAQLSLDIADRGYVIENGRVVLSGSGQDLLQSKDVAERYLGVGATLNESLGRQRDAVTANLRQLLMS